MASTYTSNIRLEKQADGENPNAWGAILNTNVIDLVDQAVAAYQIVSVSGTTPITLTQVNGATDQSRKAILSFDGTLTAETSIIIPSVNKMYYVRNNTSGSFALKIKTAGNTAITVEQGSNVMVASDGTDVYQTAFPTSVSSFTANSLTATSVSTSVLNASKISTSIVSATNIHATSVSAVSGRFSGTVSASAFDGLGNKLSFGSDAQGDIYYYAGNSIARLAAGTNGFLLKTQGSGANPVWSDPSNITNIVQEQSSFTSEGRIIGVTGANPAPRIFLDSSKPQNTEGAEVTALRVTITPTNASSFLIANADIYLEGSNPTAAVAALFVDSSSDSLAASTFHTVSSGQPHHFKISFGVTAGGTSQKIFKIRAGFGVSTTNTLQLNNGDSNIFGTGSFTSKLTIKEITQ